MNVNDFEMKGIKCRISLDDTLAEANSKILKSIFNGYIESNFELFEVCQDSKTKLCRVLRSYQGLWKM